MIEGLEFCNYWEQDKGKFSKSKVTIEFLAAYLS